MTKTEKSPLVVQVPDGAASPLHHLVAQYRARHAGRLLTEDIVRILQEAIVRMIYGPGRSLRQDELAEVFGVSKIPVREAFRTLEAFGFVDLPHNRGAVVKELTVEQIRDVYELRLLIEPHLVRIAFPELAAAALDEAGQLVDAMDKERNAWAWSELNVRFHRLLYASAHRPLAARFLSMLEGHVQRYSVMQLSLAGRNRMSNEDHRQILAACRADDIDEAVRLLATHVSEVKDIVIALHEDYGVAGAALALRRSPQSSQEKTA